MNITGWKFYNHAAVPAISVQEQPDTSFIENGDIWKMTGTPLLARWITEFDCGYETNWWYVIKDEPFDMTVLKAKRRYEVNKGIKYFDVKVIEPLQHKEKLYEILVAAYSAYPEKYRPKVDKEVFLRSIYDWDKYIVFGAFFKDTEEMQGYALLTQVTDDFIDFNILKTNPSYEKHSINAALVDGILSHFSERLASGAIISDGARSISHETKFQDYLEKYFGFRKAYCNLHIAYNPKIGWMVKLLFPFRNLLIKLDGIGIVHQVNSVLKMEKIRREEV